MPIINFDVKLRCTNCHKSFPPFSLNDIPERMSCACGKIYSYAHGFLDTLCGDDISSIQIDHMPDWDAISDHSLLALKGNKIIYDALELNRRFSPALMKTLDRFAPKSANRSVLDIGLGVVSRRKIRPYYSDLLTYFNNYVGLDPSTLQLEKTNEEEEIQNSLFIRAVGEKLPFENDNFDAVLLLSTLDHCVAPINVKNEIVRILKPGGLLMVSLNNDGSWFKIIFPRKAQRLRELSAKDHNYFFSCKEINSLLSNDFFVIHQHDFRYFPMNYCTTNALIGKPYLWFLSLIESIGRYFLPGRGGNFIIVARKALI